jgi:glutamate decarboxylase
LDHVTPFVASADREAEIKHDGGARLTAENQRSALVAPRAPRELEKILGDALVVKQEGSGKEGLGELVGKVLGWSVNTWDQGFMVGFVHSMCFFFQSTRSHQTIVQDSQGTLSS